VGRADSFPSGVGWLNVDGPILEVDELPRGDAPLAVFLAPFEDIAGPHPGELLKVSRRERERRVVVLERGVEGIEEITQPVRDDLDDFVLLAGPFQLDRRGVLLDPVDERHGESPLE